MRHTNPEDFLPAQNGGGDSYKWVVLLITTVGVFMTPLDGSIVGIALPTIVADLGLDFTTALWVPTAYLLVITVLLISFGRLADMKGRRLPFISGFTVFTAASVLCSLSQSGTQLIIFRVVQGVGAALIAANAPAIVTEVFPSSERGKALGINTMAVYAGLAVGPTLGGLLVQSLGWRSIFYVNLPIGVTVIAIALLKLRESRVSVGSSQRFDFAGAGTFSVGLTTLLAGLTLGESYGWMSLSILSLFAVGGCFLTLFVLIEGRMAEDAMLDVSLFLRNRLFAAANLTALLNYISIFAVSFLMAFYLQNALGYTPAQAGVLLLPMPLTMVVLSPVSGWLSDRFGSRLLSSAGMALICIALFLLSTLGVDSSSTDVVARLVILGFGMGLFSSPNTSAVMGSVEKWRLGLASGTLATMRFMGQSISLAVMGAVVATSVPSQVLTTMLTGIETGSGKIAAEAFVEGTSKALLVSGFISVVGIFTSLVRGKHKPQDFAPRKTGRQ